MVNVTVELNEKVLENLLECEKDTTEKQQQLMALAKKYDESNFKELENNDEYKELTYHIGINSIITSDIARDICRKVLEEWKKTSQKK